MFILIFIFNLQFFTPGEVYHNWAGNMTAWVQDEPDTAVLNAVETYMIIVPYIYGGIYDPIAYDPNFRLTIYPIDGITGHLGNQYWAYVVRTSTDTLLPQTNNLPPFKEQVIVLDVNDKMPVGYHKAKQFYRRGFITSPPHKLISQWGARMRFKHDAARLLGYRQ